MNCRNFAPNITELARGQMLEARAKDETLAHLQECQRCAARFADEQALTTGLSSVAATTATVKTPSHVEEALLLAFRQRRDAASSTVVPFKPTKVMPRWMPLSIAAAAALLVVATLSLLRLLPTGAHESAPQMANSSSPSQTTAPSAPTEAQTEPDAPGIDIPDNPDPQRSNEMTPSYAVNRPRSTLRSSELNGRTNRRDASYPSATNASEEVATDFLPLSYGSDLTQLEGGQVVRVELPRAALQSLGLPMNVERAGERVKADVLIGSDGVARAIRFIR